MRRLSLRLALVAAALLCGPLPLLAQQRAPAVRGDVNGDGRITSADALAVMAYLRGRTLPANFDVPGRGDADGDGVITRADAERITRLAVGKEVSAELPGAPGNAARLECVANVQSRTVQCTQPGSRGAGTALADRIVYGGQNQYVTLTSSNVTVAGDIFAFDVTVRNLIRQPIGTNDGVTADTNGVQVLFANGVQNTTPGGSGSITVNNEDGTGVFTGSDQEYFKYVGILAKNQVSAPRNWQLKFDPGVQSFRFQLYVSSPVQFPRGYVVVTPAADTLFVGGTVQLTDSVRTAVDNPIPGQTVTWSTSDTAIATVSSSGLVTAAGAGVATITATNTRGDTIRTGTATITVLGTPAAYRVTASDSTPAVRDSIIVSAQLVDGNGDPVPAAGRTVTWSTSTTGTFASPTSTTDAAGVATTKFYTDSVATTATLTATEGALSGSVTITTGASAASTARSTITASPDTITADGAATSTITVQLIDAFGNALTASGGTVTLSTTAGTLSAVTDNGNGTYTATLTAPATVGSATITGAIDGNAIADDATVTFIAGAAASLSITTQPSDTARSGTAFARQPVIQLRDASGNAVAQAGVTVTAAIASGAGTLGGTVTAVTDASGTATFTDLSITGTAGAYTLSFSATGLTSATSTTITITAGTASQLTITTQPSDTARSGAAFTRQPVVQLRDASGNAVAQAGVTVTAAIASGGGTLGGTVTATTDASGTATFTDLSITGTTGDRTLSFSATGVTSATSNTVTITAGAATQIFLTTPATTVAGVAQTVTVTAQDASGNTATGYTGTIHFTSTDPAAVLPADYTFTAADAGTHQFSATLRTAGTRAITATDTGNSALTSTANVTVSPAAAATLAFTVQPSNTAAGAIITPSVRVTLYDAFGNVATGATDNVTVAIGTNPASGTLSGTTTVAAVAGVATFADLSINRAGTGYTLAATSGTLTGATSTAFNVTPGALHHFLVEAAAGGPIGNQQTGVAFNVRVTAQDSLNNTVTGFTGTVNFTSTPAGGISAGGTSGAFTGGVLASHSITFGTPGAYTLTATRAGGTESGTSNAFEVQSPPTATDDGPAAGSTPGQPYHALYSTAASPQTFTLAAPGVLANDNLGFPTAAITSFGADSLGGTVTTYAAGSTVSPLPGTGRTTGSLSVGANGSITFTPPDGFTGNYVFHYRLTNARGFVDAKVTIAVGARPAATADTYSPVLVGNVPINTATSTQFRVTANDAGDAKVLGASSPTNGTVTLNQDGTFTFRPTRGFEGTASFSYTVANGFGTTAPVTVTLTVGAPVYFVDASAAAGGDGVYDARYNSLANLAAANNGTGTNPAANDRIFLYSGTYAAPLTLLAGQRLVGQGATGASFSAAVGVTWPADSGPEPTINGTSPTITSTGTGLTLGSGNTLSGFNLGTVATGAALTGTSFGTLTVTNVGINTTGQGLSLTTGTLNGGFTQLRSTGGVNNVFLSGVATTGTSTLGAVGDVLSGATGDAVVVAGGTGSFTFPANITQASNAATLNVSGGHNGTLTFAGTIGATNGTGLQFNNADGTYSFTGTPTLNGGNAGIDVTNGSSGTFTFPATASITNPTAETITITNSAPTFTYPGSLTKTNNSASGITLNGNTGGTIAFTGAVKVFSTATATAVNLVTNTGTTITFADSLRITTTSGIGFNATGGGTVSVAGTHNSITSAGGIAANVVSTTIGAGGMNFRSISANGGTNGIVLNNTGTTAGLTVTGTGAAGTGGTIQNTTVSGISLTSGQNMSLSWMTLTNANTTDGGGAGVCDGATNAGCNGAIKLNGVRAVTLDRLAISGSAEQGINGINVTGLTLSNSTIAGAGNEVNESGLYLFGLFGTTAAGTANSITNTTVTGSGSANHNVFIRNSTATNAAPGAPDRLVISGSSFVNPGAAITPSDGITVSLRGSANFQTVVQSSTFSQATAANGTDGIQVDAGDASTSDVSITGSTFTGWNQAPINLSSAGTATQAFNVASNPTISAGVGNGINVIANNSSVARGFVTSNGNITSGNATNNGVGISLEADVNGRVIASVSNNTVTNFAYGVYPKARETGAAQVDLTLQSNTVTAGGNNAFAGMFAEAGNGDGQNTRMCLNLTNNQISKGSNPSAFIDYSLGQYAGSTFQLQGFAGAGTNATAVQSFISSRDIGGAGVDVTAGTTVNFTTATCAAP